MSATVQQLQISRPNFVGSFLLYGKLDLASCNNYYDLYRCAWLLYACSTGFPLVLSETLEILEMPKLNVVGVYYCCSM